VSARLSFHFKPDDRPEERRACGRPVSSDFGPVFVANNGTDTGRLYAADFANGKIDVFDTNYALTTVAGCFVDATIPAGYHPYNTALRAGIGFWARGSAASRGGRRRRGRKKS
jgi:hypothetical protein